MKFMQIIGQRWHLINHNSSGEWPDRIPGPLEWLPACLQDLFTRRKDHPFCGCCLSLSSLSPPLGCVLVSHRGKCRLRKVCLTMWLAWHRDGRQEYILVTRRNGRECCCLWSTVNPSVNHQGKLSFFCSSTILFWYTFNFNSKYKLQNYFPTSNYLHLVTQCCLRKLYVPLSFYYYSFTFLFESTKRTVVWGINPSLLVGGLYIVQVYSIRSEVQSTKSINCVTHRFINVTGQWLGFY